MSMQAGDAQASSGMAKAIYDQLDAALGEGLGSAELEPLRPGWKKLAYAIAQGVVSHIQANLEIKDLQTQGDVQAVPALAVTFTQVTGTGRVE